MRSFVTPFRHLSLLLLVFCLCGAAFAQSGAGTLPLKLMPNKTFSDVQTQAAFDAISGPVFSNSPTTLPFHTTLTGSVTADATMTKLAIHSDDGSDVYVNGVKVWSSLDQGQALPDIANSLHELPITMTPGQTYTVRIDYSNIIYNPPDPTTGQPLDIDGCTLFVYGAAVKDFSLTAAPASLNVFASQSATSTITVNAINGFTDNVTLSAAATDAKGNAVTGMTAAFSANPVSPGATSTMTVTATNIVSAGTYMLTVTGIDGALSHTAVIAVTVPGVQSVYSDPTVAAEIMSGALNDSDHTIVIYAQLNSAVAGITVHFLLTDTSPSTIPASLSIIDVVTDADGLAKTVLTSSNTGAAGYIAQVSAYVKSGNQSDIKSTSVTLLLPDNVFGSP